MTRARTRARKNFTLAASTIAILAGCDNASTHIDRLVQSHERRWRDALAVVRTAGLTGGVMLAACDALRGQRIASQIAHELAGVWQLVTWHDFGVGSDAWDRLVAVVRDRPDVAESMLVLAEECWAGNAACRWAMSRVTSG